MLYYFHLLRPRSVYYRCMVRLACGYASLGQGKTYIRFQLLSRIVPSQNSVLRSLMPRLVLSHRHTTRIPAEISTPPASHNSALLQGRVWLRPTCGACWRGSKSPLLVTISIKFDRGLFPLAPRCGNESTRQYNVCCGFYRLVWHLMPPRAVLCGVSLTCVHSEYYCITGHLNASLEDSQLAELVTQGYLGQKGPGPRDPEKLMGNAPAVLVDLSKGHILLVYELTAQQPNQRMCQRETGTVSCTV